MERKSMGSFIAALRRAKGLTQRQLAEMLNVSDKAVSRWERDECAPDLSLIPVIAELFGVTCDELLRGERTAETAKVGGDEHASECDALSTKGQKMLKRLLQRRYSSLRSQSLIAGCIAVVGFVTALICNFCFSHARLGFLLSLIFYGAATICEAIFFGNSAVEEDEQFDPKLLNAYKLRRVKCAMLTYLLICELLALNSPLLFVSEFYGLNLTWTTVFISLAAAVGMAIIYFMLWRFWICPAMRRSGTLPSTEEMPLSMHLTEATRSYLKKSLLIFGSLMAVTLAALILWANVFGYFYWLKPSKVFYDFDSFIAYMETPQEMDGSPWAIEADDLSGFATEQICDDNGRVLCEYRPRNTAVCGIEQEAGGLPIRVYTYSDYRKADAIHNAVESGLIGALFTEGIAGAAVILTGLRKRQTKET